MSATGNGSLRLLAAQVVIQDWRLHDDTRQPHSSLKYKTPVDFAAQFANQILLFLLDTKFQAGHYLLLEHGVKPKRLSNAIRFRCSPGTSSASGIGGGVAASSEAYDFGIPSGFWVGCPTLAP
jgi:hypothetical protein